MGRDVESMVRDLVETAIRLVKEEKMLSVKERAEKNANQRLVELLVPSNKKTNNIKILLKCSLAVVIIRESETQVNQMILKYSRKTKNCERKISKWRTGK